MRFDGSCHIRERERLYRIGVALEQFIKKYSDCLMGLELQLSVDMIVAFIVGYRYRKKDSKYKRTFYLVEFIKMQVLQGYDNFRYNVKAQSAANALLKAHCSSLYLLQWFSKAIR